MVSYLFDYAVQILDTAAMDLYLGELGATCSRMARLTTTHMA
jgi:hypothetical protein